ncbi:1-aminocyclopropane-1-carboxylate oxidase homolog 1-like [Rhodamnia argentea]|uniref:1-aminocyclopropane-1-carboxylate oxidase homolog 1-like n=1 Tax=Rhodamnia argentea TaxID=178133 RepID=A0ABM3HA74_9MYRT|nr:1-aminocyclopropane-1-carboxylate oxidase homolog 1-like [Rhodamnia argentea]
MWALPVATSRCGILGKHWKNGVLPGDRPWGPREPLGGGDRGEGSRRLFEQETEAKKGFYTGDFTKRVIYNSNAALSNSVTADWRDSIFCSMGPEPPQPEELPEAFGIATHFMLFCGNPSNHTFKAALFQFYDASKIFGGEMLMEYSKHVTKPGSCPFELLSEALGHRSNQLMEMECGKRDLIMCNFCPPCPQPKLTLGVTKQSDKDFLTILLQDQIGGLQVLHENQRIHVPPILGAQVINIGDLLRPSSRPYGPIKELTSADNPPIYKETTLPNYTANYISKGVYGTYALPDFKL